MTTLGPSPVNDALCEHVKDTMIHTWEEDTHEAYGSLLLMWHCFCDHKAVPKFDRAPGVGLCHAHGIGLLRQDHIELPTWCPGLAYLAQHSLVS